MSSVYTHLGIIPARSGSKRFLNKNLAQLDGIPLLDYTIGPALSSKLFTKIILSSDSPEILSQGSRPGVTPVQRPAALSTDEATSVSVLLHHLEEEGRKGFLYDFVWLLQPTSPFRLARHFLEAFTLLGESDAFGCVSIVEYAFPPEYALEFDGSVVQPARKFGAALKSLSRDQDVPTWYHPNGAFYIAHSQSIKSNRSFYFDGKTMGYPMGRVESMDINTEEDLKVAEELLRIVPHEPWSRTERLSKRPR